MEPGGSLPHSLEHTSCSYPEPDQSSQYRAPHPTTYVNMKQKLQFALTVNYIPFHCHSTDGFFTPTELTG